MIVFMRLLKFKDRRVFKILFKYTAFERPARDSGMDISSFLYHYANFERVIVSLSLEY